MKQSTRTERRTSGNLQQLREQRFAYPSYHAAKRISQRTSMEISELMSALDNEACVNIGQYAGSHRRHLLFYSPKDKFCYVAIQDERYGKIITILPPAYHKNLAWKITDEQYELAKARYESYAELVSAQTKVIKLKKETPPPEPRSSHRMWIQALYISEDQKPKRKTLFRMSVDEHLGSIEQGVAEILKDPTLYQEIDEHIKLKGVFQGTIYAVCFKYEKYAGDIQTLNLRSQQEAERHAERYAVMRRDMNQMLSVYMSPYLALPAPESVPVLRLSWDH